MLKDQTEEWSAVAVPVTVCKAQTVEWPAAGISRQVKSNRFYLPAEITVSGSWKELHVNDLLERGGK